MTNYSPSLRQNERRMSASDTAQRGPIEVVAAILLIVAAMEFWTVEAIAALAWKNPSYSYASNFISDLGAPDCSTFQGRVVCSPLHDLMNISFIAHGVLFLIAGLLLVRLVSGPSRYFYLILTLLYGIGYILVGTFHGSTAASQNGTLAYHYLGASVAILGGNIIAVGVSFQWRFLGTPRWFGIESMVLGILGIIAALLVFPTIGIIPSGIIERIAVYAFLQWQMQFAFALLRSVRQRRLSKMREYAQVKDSIGGLL